MSSSGTRLVMVGGGNMGAALLGGMLAAGWCESAEVAVVEVLAGRRDQLVAQFAGVTITDTVVPADAALIAVKPNDVAGAIDRLVVSPYDLVTLDLNLPDGDGLDLARRVREDPAFAPLEDEAAPRILMLTARDGVGERVVGLDQGADDYLVKPFAFAELSARVRSLMRRDAGRSSSPWKAARNRQHQPPLNRTQVGVQMRFTTGQMPVKWSSRPAAIPAAPARTTP